MVADKVELVMRFHPVDGEGLSLTTTDFRGESEAVEAVSRALDEHRSLVLLHARDNREASENSVVVNLANVVSVRIGNADSEAAGQYL